MIPGIEPVTLKEAQFLLGRPQEELSRAIERGEVERLSKVVAEPAKPKKRRRPSIRRRAKPGRETTIWDYRPSRTVNRVVRTLGPSELLYFSLGRDVSETLTPAGRRKLYDAIKTLPKGADAVRVGPFDVSLKAATARLIKRYRALKDLRTGIVEQGDDEPLLKGTDISVYRIAALAEGQGVEETLEDYPSLNPKQVERAVEYARAYPKKGRPYPEQSFKRAAANLVASGALSVEPRDAVDISPDRFR
jgi:hypothetical protein